MLSPKWRKISMTQKRFGVYPVPSHMHSTPPFFLSVYVELGWKNESRLSLAKVK